MGLITQEERHEAVVEQWNACTEEVADAMVANLDVLNPIFMMANSGARGSFKQIRQLAGMRGLMANPKGEIIERPVKANFMEGLDVLEYFISTHGARKGLADTALRTADSGYLTRRLVDVAQDVIIREPDCGTEEYIELALYKESGDLNDNLLGRFAAKDIATKRGRVIVEKAAQIDRAELADIIESAAGDQLKTDHHGVVKIAVRSVLKCEASSGVCQACYGRSMASGQTAQIGDAVGIIAAQSIGEPGTQLTMRTFHTGGVAGADITHGLPRVVELFEARKPKGLAKIAEQDGTISLEETDKALTVVITDDAGEEHRHTFPRRTRAVRRDGPARRGRARSSTRGRCTRTSCWRSAAARRPSSTSSRRCRRSTCPRAWTSTTSTSSSSRARCSRRCASTRRATRTTCPGQFVDRFEFARVNNEIIAKGGEPAQFEDIILGITKASLNTDSFLSAASFQETTKVLTDAALEGKIDRLNGLKENVIIGKLIPAATGLKRYRRIEIEPSEPLPRAMDDVGLLDQDEIAAELGLGDGDGLGGFGAAFNDDIASLEEMGTGGGDTGFAEELADLDVPGVGSPAAASSERPSGSSGRRFAVRGPRSAADAARVKPWLPVQLPTESSTRPSDTLRPARRPRTRIAVPRSGVPAPTKRPSGAIFTLRSFAVPIWVVNWPAVMPGQSIGTFASKSRSSRPFAAIRNETDFRPGSAALVAPVGARGRGPVARALDVDGAGAGSRCAASRS